MPERTLTPEILQMHVGILGKTGSGKSNLAKATVENLLDDGARVCVIDPTGTWYGLRLMPDRKPSPYPVVMFGGQHADIAIGRTHGAAVAETIGTTSTPAVIDTRTMTVGERTQFFTDFAETLLQRNQGPLHLVIDEAHLFAPQGRVADPKSGQMLHAANNLVSLGRGIGLRIILISQRPAKLHKDSLTQIETLVAMRVIAPQDRRAIEDWIGEWAEAKQGAELVASLASLKTGEAWIWSPEAGILERRQTPLARTLDTGKPSGQPVELGTIDIAAVQERLGEVAKDVLANDPKTLKAQIATLQRELAARPTDTQIETVERIVEVPVLNGQVDKLAEVVRDLRQIGEGMVLAGTGLAQTADSITAAISRVQMPAAAVSAPAPRKEATMRPGGVTAAEPRAMPRGPVGQPARPSPSRLSDGEVPLSPTERAVLTALAQYPAGRSQQQAAILSGYSPTSGGFYGALARLRRSGFMEGGKALLAITEAGRDALGSWEPLPTGAQLIEHWYGRLNPTEAAVLRALLVAWPDGMAQADVAATAGYSATSGGFYGALAKLRKLELISGGSAAGLRASDELGEHA